MPVRRKHSRLNEGSSNSLQLRNAFRIMTSRGDDKAADAARKRLLDDKNRALKGEGGGEERERGTGSRDSDGKNGLIATQVQYRGAQVRDRRGASSEKIALDFASARRLPFTAQKYPPTVYLQPGQS